MLFWCSLCLAINVYATFPIRNKIITNHDIRKKNSLYLQEQEEEEDQEEEQEQQGKEGEKQEKEEQEDVEQER